jgi:hypothetical protein
MDALEKIRTMTAKASGHQRNLTFRTVASTPRASVFMSKDFSTQGDSQNAASTMILKQVDVKPRLLESRVTEDGNFMKLSDGFRRVFANEKEDKKLVLPIAGYGGHRRGDRSQNFFGRPFREISIQSKRL